MDPQNPESVSQPHAWLCPECQRRVPAHIDLCRCGMEKRRLEAIGYKFDAPPPNQLAVPHIAPLPRVPGLPEKLFGYRSDVALKHWRFVAMAVIVLATLGVARSTTKWPTRELPRTRENIEVVARLEDFTRDAGSKSPNTIPAFLALHGTPGALSIEGADDDPVAAIDLTEFRQGFCSLSVARQIRHQYPGYYDRWSDTRLERVVLQKYPEYKDRLCVLSFKVDAAAADIMMYELKTRSLAGRAGLWLAAGLVTGLVALGLLNLYYRLLVDRLATALA